MFDVFYKIVLKRHNLLLQLVRRCGRCLLAPVAGASHWRQLLAPVTCTSAVCTDLKAVLLELRC